MKSWSLEVQKLEDGDEYIEFPKEVMEEVGWEDGDIIEWIDNGDGSWTLKKKLNENHENTEQSDDAE